MNLYSSVSSFLKYLKTEKKASKKTIENYSHYLKRFTEFTGDINLSEINLTLIRKFKLYLEYWSDKKTKKPLKKITQNYFMIALRELLRYLSKQGIETLSAEQIKLNNTEISPIKVLDENCFQKLLNAPDISSNLGIRDRLLLEILFSTGLKVSEVVLLNRDSINLNHHEFPVISKSLKKRVVFLSDPTIYWLDVYLKIRKDSFKPLFIRYQGKVDLTPGGELMRLSPRSIERIVEKYVKEAGISVKATPHTLRHSFATDSLIKGVNIESLQEQLGHAHITTTTQIYSQKNNPLKT